MRRLALTVLLFAMGAATAAALMTWRQPAAKVAEAAAHRAVEENCAGAAADSSASAITCAGGIASAADLHARDDEVRS